MSVEETDKKLVYMANQIATFFAHQSDDQAIEEIAAHIRKFWEKRMREKITALAATGAHGLSPRALAAVNMLAHTSPVKTG